MKILVLSLLRLGDLLMHQEILEALDILYPEAQIDLLAQESCRHAVPILSKQRTVHFFPRMALQDQLVLKDKSFFRAYLDIKQWAIEVQNAQYTHVIDLTHTHFSKALIDALEIPEWCGQKHSYLNDIFADCTRSSFHYVDALFSSLQITNPRSLPKAEERQSSVIVVQPLTSDAKKNWSLASYRDLVSKLLNKYPDCQVKIVGSPQERNALAQNFQSIERVSLEICSLPELRQILCESRFLISGDTATLHLATSTRTPSLGIYLGSAEPTKTAPRLQGAVILQSNEACVPCRHSSACPQPAHLCAQSLSSESVFNVLLAVIEGNQTELKRLAWDSSFSIFRVGQTSFGFSTLEDLSQAESEFQQLVRQVTFANRATRTQHSVEQLTQAFAGELWELSVFVEERLRSFDRVFEVIKDLQIEVRSISKACLRMDKKTENHGIRLAPLVKEFGFLSEDHEWTSVLEAALVACSHETSFVVYRRWRALLDDLVAFTDLNNEMYLQLRSYLHERGVYYVPGPTRTT